MAHDDTRQDSLRPWGVVVSPEKEEALLAAGQAAQRLASAWEAFWTSVRDLEAVNRVEAEVTTKDSYVTPDSTTGPPASADPGASS